jgi:hypothetical protein
MVGTTFTVLGLIIVVFRHPVAVGFCRIGKRLFKNSPKHLRTRAEEIYNEEKAPPIIGILGAHMAILGAYIAFVLPR